MATHMIGTAYYSGTKAGGVGDQSNTSGLDLTQYDYVHGQLRTNGGHTIHYGTNKLWANEFDADGASALKLGADQATGVELGASDADTTVKGDLSVDGSAEITGNLTVSGTLFNVSSTDVLISDRYINVASGNVQDAAQEGGMVVNVDRGSGGDLSGNFVVGVDATSNPTVGFAVATYQFQDGDIIMIDGSTSNDGLYEVLSHAADVLTVRGVGTSGQTSGHEYTQNQFPTAEAAVGKVYHMKVSVIRAGTDGAFETGFGDNTKAATNGRSQLTFSDLATSVGSTLTSAYQAGNTLTTDAGNGDFLVSGTESMGVSVDGSVSLDGATGISLQGNAAEIDMTTTGALDLNSGAGTWDASTLSLDSTDTTNLTMTASDLGDKTLTIAALNSGLGAGNIDMDADGITIDAAGAFSLDGASASNVSVTDANLTLSTISSLLGGNVVINAEGATAKVTLNAETDVEIDAGLTGGVSIDAGAASNFTTVSGALTLDGGSGVNIAGNSSEVDITTTGALDLNSAVGTWDSTSSITLTSTLGTGTGIALNASSSAFDIQGNEGSTINVTSGNLSLSTTTSGNVSVTADGAGLVQVDGGGGITLQGNSSEVDVTTTGALDLNSGAGTWDSSAGISLDGAATSNFTTSSGDLTVKATAGSLIIEGGEAAVDAVTIATTGVGGGIDIDSGTGGITIDSTGGISIDAAGASNLTTSSGALTLSAAGGISVTSDMSFPTGQTGSADFVTFALPGTLAAPTWAAAPEGSLVYNEGNDDLWLKQAAGWVEVNIGGSVTLQEAYDNGDGGIVTDATGDFAVSGSEGINFDVGKAISLDADLASNFTTSAGAITIDGASGVNIAGNAAEVDITTTGAVDINSGAGTWNGSTIGITGTGAVTVTGAGVNIAGGSSEVDITTTGALDMNSAAGTWDSSAGISLDAAAASNFTTSAGKLTLSGDDGVDIVSATAGQPIAFKPTAESNGEYHIQYGATADFGMCWNAGAPDDTPVTGDLYEKGTLWIDYTNGHLYINQGTKAAPQWVKVGTQS